MSDEFDKFYVGFHLRTNQIQQPLNIDTINNVTRLLQPDIDADSFSNLFERARDFLNRGETEEAFKVAENALAEAESVGNSYDVASANVLIGDIKLKEGQTDSANQNFEKALELFESVGDTKGIISSLSALGKLHRKLSRFSTAIEYQTRCLLQNEEIRDFYGIARSCVNIANIYNDIGDSQKALTFHYRALSMYESMDNDKEIAKSLGNIGAVYINLGQFDGAIEFLQKSISMNTRLERKLGLASNLGNVGAVHFYRGEYPEALEKYSEALSQFEEIGDKFQIAHNASNVAMAYQNMKNFPEALKLANKALDLYTEIGSQHGIARTTVMIGVIYCERNQSEEDYEKAEQLLLKGLALLEELGAKGEVYHVHHHLSEFYELLGNDAKAFTHHKIYHSLEKEIQSEAVKGHAMQLEIGRQVEKKELSLALERASAFANQKVLHNVLPKTIAEKVLRGDINITERLDNVTILFADIVGFTQLSERIGSDILVERLNTVFTAFDAIVEKYGLEKIKTIGDAYMAAGGAPEARIDHAHAMALLAFEMQEAVINLGVVTGEECMTVRVGIHTGEVVAGVIGTKKFTYDLWGDTVNIASRMESHCEPGRIHVSEKFKRRFDEVDDSPDGDEFHRANISTAQRTIIFEDRGDIEIKGKGLMRTFYISRVVQ